MMDFIRAALPWVLMGLAIIIVSVRYSKKKQGGELSQEKDANTKEQDDTYMLEGMMLGMCLGSGLGAAGLFNIGTGLSVGMLLGLAIGYCIKKTK